jgi:ribosomal protein S18 acetylase RimI-like enzyme
MPHWFVAAFLVVCYFFAVYAPILILLVVIVWWFCRVTPASLVRNNAFVNDFAPPEDAPVSYSEFTEAEVQEVFEMEAAIFKITSGLELPRYYSSPFRFALVAKIEDRVVGFVLCTRNRSGLSIDQLAVHPNTRRRGVGRRLTQEAIDQARANRSREVSLWTRRGTNEALPMYQSMGFEIVGGDNLMHKMVLTLTYEPAEAAEQGQGERPTTPD